MGQQISCNNYYCQSIDYQPDWFSSSHYSISSNQTEYQIERGILHLLPSSHIDLTLSKKIEIQDISSFSIPLQFQYQYPFPLSFQISLHSHPSDFTSSSFSIQFLYNQNHIEIQKDIHVEMHIEIHIEINIKSIEKSYRNA
jgi:hypothetical protein